MPPRIDVHVWLPDRGPTCSGFAGRLRREFRAPDRGAGTVVTAVPTTRTTSPVSAAGHRRHRLTLAVGRARSRVDL